MKLVALVYRPLAASAALQSALLFACGTDGVRESTVDQCVNVANSDGSLDHRSEIRPLERIPLFLSLFAESSASARTVQSRTVSWVARCKQNVAASRIQISEPIEILIHHSLATNYFKFLRIHLAAVDTNRCRYENLAEIKVPCFRLPSICAPCNPCWRTVYPEYVVNTHFDFLFPILFVDMLKGVETHHVQNT